MKNLTLVVTGTLSSNSGIFSTLLIPLKLVFENTGPPYFDPSLSPIEVAVGSSYKYTFPSIADPDALDLPVLEGLPSFGIAQTFITGSYPTYLIAPTLAS